MTDTPIAAPLQNVANHPSLQAPSAQSTGVGFHASHEQLAPSTLLRCVTWAEQAGFNAMMCSDHFHPWTADQGQSGHSWSWLGAAMASTSLPAGVVTTPGYRQHPALVAQAAATLAEMFEERFWVAVGSGEALNECIVGGDWPHKAARNDRLRACVDIMRALWAGEEVTCEGPVPTRRARLFTRPDRPPPIFVAAMSPETAAWAAPWADGLITASGKRESMRAVLEAFREHGGGNKPVVLQVKLSYADSDALALAEAHAQWRANILASEVLSQLSTPSQFEAAGAWVRPEDVQEAVRVSCDLAWHTDQLLEDLDEGYSHLMLHNVNLRQQAFIEAFGERVLPALLARRS